MKLSELECYCFESDDGCWLCPTRYWNANGFAGAVVAVLNFYEDKLYDWTAYIGGCNMVWHEKDAERWVAEHGVKIPREDTKYFFPDLPPELWRP